MAVVQTCTAAMTLHTYAVTGAATLYMNAAAVKAHVEIMPMKATVVSTLLLFSAFRNAMSSVIH